MCMPIVQTTSRHAVLGDGGGSSSSSSGPRHSPCSQHDHQERKSQLQAGVVQMPVVRVSRMQNPKINKEKQETRNKKQEKKTPSATSRLKLVGMRETGQIRTKRVAPNIVFFFCTQETKIEETFQTKKKLCLTPELCLLTILYVAAPWPRTFFLLSSGKHLHS